MSESELIAEMADIIDIIRQDCLCGFPESCRDCYYNQEAKKIIGKAYAFLGCDDLNHSQICKCFKCRLMKIKYNKIACTECGSKTCHKAEYHGWRCTGSDDPGQSRHGLDGKKPPQDTAAATTQSCAVCGKKTSNLTPFCENNCTKYWCMPCYQQWFEKRKQEITRCQPTNPNP